MARTTKAQKAMTKEEQAAFIQKIQTAQPNEHQEAIFEAARTQSGQFVVLAGPGSGKTFTSIKASTVFEGSSIYFSYNKKIQIDTNNKLVALDSKMQATTAHAFGLSCLQAYSRGQAKVDKDERKYPDIVRQYIAANWTVFLQTFKVEIEDSEEDINVMHLDASAWTKQLTHFVQVSLVDPTEANLLMLVNHFDLDIKPTSIVWSFVCNAVPFAIEEGLRQFEGHQHLVSFDDMIYYPNIINGVPVRQFDHIIVDEAQDTSKASLELMLKACHSKTQIFFVGDRKQSIYAFAGASFNSIDQIIERLNAQTLPLRVCYRCGSKIVGLANQLGGELIAAGSHTGNVDVVGDDYLDRLQPGDAVLSRTTKKLVQACLKVLQTGKRAKVLGKNIGDNIAAVVTILEAMREVKRGKLLLESDLSNLLTVLTEYHNREAKSLEESRENPELALSELEDKVGTVRSFFEAYIGKCNNEALRVEDDPKCSFNKTAKDFKLYIKGLFSDEDTTRDFILFMTVHRSKGGEWENVYIIGTDEFPHPKAKSDRQKQQEENLMYVAITRAIENLYFVNAPFSCLELEGYEPSRGLTIVSAPSMGYLAITPSGLQETNGFHHDEIGQEEIVIEASTVVEQEESVTSEGRVSRVSAIEVLCPSCNSPCMNPQTQSQFITYELVGHTVICTSCQKSCIVPLNAFSLQGDIVAREKQTGQTTKREKLGRTKKERKSTKGRKPEGKTVKEPLQLSVDIMVYNALNLMGVNKSKLFVELLEQYEPFIEAYATVVSETDELDHDEIEEDENEDE